MNESPQSLSEAPKPSWTRLILDGPRGSLEEFYVAARAAAAAQRELDIQDGFHTTQSSHELIHCGDGLLYTVKSAKSLYNALLVRIVLAEGSLDISNATKELHIPPCAAEEFGHSFICVGNILRGKNPYAPLPDSPKPKKDESLESSKVYTPETPCARLTLPDDEAIKAKLIGVYVNSIAGAEEQRQRDLEHKTFEFTAPEERILFEIDGREYAVKSAFDIYTAWFIHMLLQDGYVDAYLASVKFSVPDRVLHPNWFNLSFGSLQKLLGEDSLTWVANPLKPKQADTSSVAPTGVAAAAQEFQAVLPERTLSTLGSGIAAVSEKALQGMRGGIQKLVAAVFAVLTKNPSLDVRLHTERMAYLCRRLNVNSLEEIVGAKAARYLSEHLFDRLESCNQLNAQLPKSYDIQTLENLTIQTFGDFNNSDNPSSTTERDILVVLSTASARREEYYKFLTAMLEHPSPAIRTHAAFGFPRWCYFYPTDQIQKLVSIVAQQRDLIASYRLYENAESLREHDLQRRYGFDGPYKEFMNKVGSIVRAAEHILAEESQKRKKK